MSGLSQNIKIKSFEDNIGSSKLDSDIIIEQLGKDKKNY